MSQQKSTGLPQPSPHADEIGIVARSRAHQMATTRKRAAVPRRVAYSPPGVGRHHPASFIPFG
jgi:hypothetical protein